MSFCVKHLERFHSSPIINRSTRSGASSRCFDVLIPSLFRLWHIPIGMMYKQNSFYLQSNTEKRRCYSVFYCTLANILHMKKNIILANTFSSTL